MNHSLYLLMVFLFLSLYPMAVQAKEINYNHNSMKVSELKNKIDFDVFLPELLADDCTLEIKTYPDWANDDFTQIRLHYMDKSDKVLFVAIEQRKFSSMPTDLFNKEGDPVDINGVKGYYKTFSNAPGGILTWIQGGTYIEMSSSEKNKVEMIEIAGSMKGYK